ncbi:hypothetical protein DSECCO2_490250 [anaerobic digester metagenome]
MDAGGEVRIVQRELALGLQNQVRQVVGGVASVRSLAADGHGLPVRIAFIEGAARGGDVHVDELGHADPHALQKLHGFFFRQDAGFHVLVVIGEEVLVHAAVGDGRAGLLLDAREHLGEPLALAGLPEVAGRLAGHALGVLGHADEFGLADRVGFLRRHFAGQHGVAPRPVHDGLTDDDHGFEEGLLLAVVLGAQRIEGVQLLLGFTPYVVEAALQDLLVVVDPLDGGAEGRRLVDDESGHESFGIVVGQLVHFRGQGGVELLVEGLALPEGGDLLDDDHGVLGGDGRGRGRAVRQLLHRDVQEVAVQFGVEDAVAAVAAGAAEQELVVLDIDGHVLGDVLHGLGPAQNQRLAFGLLHGLGEIEGSFYVNARLLPVESLQHLENTTVCFAKSVFLALDFVIKPLFLRGHALTCKPCHDSAPRILFNSDHMVKSAHASKPCINIMLRQKFLFGSTSHFRTRGSMSILCAKSHNRMKRQYLPPIHGLTAMREEKREPWQSHFCIDLLEFDFFSPKNAAFLRQT